MGFAGIARVTAAGAGLFFAAAPVATSPDTATPLNKLIGSIAGTAVAVGVAAGIIAKARDKKYSDQKMELVDLKAELSECNHKIRDLREELEAKDRDQEARVRKLYDEAEAKSRDVDRRLAVQSQGCDDRAEAIRKASDDRQSKLIKDNDARLTQMQAVVDEVNTRYEELRSAFGVLTRKINNQEQPAPIAVIQAKADLKASESSSSESVPCPPAPPSTP